MIRLAVSLVLLIASLSSSCPVWAKSDWEKVVAALSHIQSATGETVWERIQTCRLKVRRDASSAEIAANDFPTINARAGDLIVELLFDAAPVPGDDPAVYRELFARWVVRQGHAEPRGGWADWLQNKPAPIGSAVWMNC